MLDPDTLKSMLAQGIPAEKVLSIAIEALEREQKKMDARRDRERAGNAIRKRRQRERHGMSRVTGRDMRDIADSGVQPVENIKECHGVTKRDNRDGDLRLYTTTPLSMDSESKSPTEIQNSGKPQKNPVLFELMAVLDEPHAIAVVDHRKKLRKPLTPHAAKLLSAKFSACPDPNAAADAMISNGWQGFDPAWLNNRNGVSHGTQRPDDDRARFRDAVRKLGEFGRGGDQAGFDLSQNGRADGFAYRGATDESDAPWPTSIP